MSNVMKKLYLLSILFIVSCASVTGGFPEDTNETSIDRATRCYYENIKEYWGDCWIQESKEEPTFEEWVEYLEMEKSWAMLQELNDKLIIGLETNATNIPEANRIFGIAVTDIDAIVNAKIQYNAKEAEIKRQKISTTLIAVGEAFRGGSGGSYQGNNFNTIQPTTLQPIQALRTFLLKRQYVEGTTKVCVYQNHGKVHNITHYNIYTPCKPSISLNL